MSTRSYSIAIGAGQTTILPAGVFFLVKSASSPISITTRGTPGAPSDFSNVSAGLSYGPVAPEKRWTYLDVTSALAQTIEIIVSDEGEVKVGNVVSVTGTTVTSVAPSSAIATPAATAPAAANATAIAANAARRRITVTLLSTSANSVWIQAAGTAADGRGIELQPGQSQVMETTAAFDVRNPTGGGVVSISTLEET